MSNFLTEEQITGRPAAAPAGAKPAVAAKGQFLSESEITGLDAGELSMRESQSIPGIIKLALESFGKPLAPYEAPEKKPFVAGPAPEFSETPGGAVTGLTRRRQPKSTEPPVDVPSMLVGSAMQASDMATSVGKQLLGAAPYWGARTAVMLKTGDALQAAEAGQLAKDYFFPPEISTPWARIAESAGPAAVKAYNENPIAWAMHKIGEFAEKGAEKGAKATGLQPQDFMAVIDQTMGSLFFKHGIKPAVAKAVKERFGEAKRAEEAAAPGPRGEPTLEEAPIPPGEAPYRSQMPEAPTAAEQSAASKARLKELKEAFKRDPETADYLKFKADEHMEGKAQELIAEAERSGRNTSADDWFGLEAEAQRIAAKPGFQRSAEEMLTVKEYNKRAATSFLERAQSQKGGIDPDVFQMITTGLIAGSLGAMALMRWLQAEEREAQKRFEEDAGKVPEGKPRPPEIDPGMPQIDRLPANGKMFYTMEELGKDVGLGGALLAAGAVKGKGGMWSKKAVQTLSAPLRKRGEVGDLANTNLVDLEAGGLTAAAVKHNFPNQRYITREEMLAVEQKQGETYDRISKQNSGYHQGGSASPELLKNIAVIGGGAAAGAWLDDSQPLRGAIAGTLAGLALGTAGGRTILKEIIKSPDVALGAISTRLGNIDPSLKLALRRHEMNVLRTLDRTNDQILPFIQAIDKLPKPIAEQAARALMNSDTAAINAIPELRATYPGVAKALGTIKQELLALNRFGEGVVDYFPRLVKDLEGLKKHLGQIYSEGIEKALLTAEANMIRKEGRSLTDVEQSLVVNRFLFASDKQAFQPGYAKSRRIEQITPDLQKFYEPPTESLLRYVSGAITDVQAAKFFGKDLAKRNQGGKSYTDIDSSIGNLTARLQGEGKLTREQGVELRNILKARFEGGDKGMSTVLANARNLTNTALLGNVASAATQIGDSLFTVYHQGAVPTIQAVAQRLLGKQKLTAKQLGLINHVAEELAGQSATGAVLQKTLKYSGFMAIDMFAKGLNLNAGLIKNTKLAQTAAGQKVLWDRYGRAFGDDMPQLIADLKARRMSDNVETLAFSELSDAQPISKAEMSEAYLRHPNGRILFQLKTYMVKQVDIVRRDAYQKIASGEPRKILEGSKNLAALAAVYALANVPGDVVKDILAGREIDPFTTPKLVENVLQTFGLNRYAQERLSQGNVVGTVQDLVTPPVRVFQDIGKTANSLLKGESDYKGLSYIPLAGRSVYERYLGGNERREIAEKKLENAGLPKDERKLLSPEAKEYLAKKRLERAERKFREEQAK